MFTAEKSQLLLEGGNQEFHKLKNTVKNHVSLGGGHLHFEALQVGNVYLSSCYNAQLMQKM